MEPTKKRYTPLNAKLPVYAYHDDDDDDSKMLGF